MFHYNDQFFWGGYGLWQTEYGLETIPSPDHSNEAARFEGPPQVSGKSEIFWSMRSCPVSIIMGRGGGGGGY